MGLIALFFPAFISMAIRHRRNTELTWEIITSLIEYAILVVVNVFLTQSVVTYGLRMDGVDSTAFCSFGFFTKYLLIASIFAFLTPYIEEVARKYISISFSVGENKE